MVFVANLQGLLSPTATADARFDENVMVEFNIDNTGDAVEDPPAAAAPAEAPAIAEPGLHVVQGVAIPVLKSAASSMMRKATRI